MVERKQNNLRLPFAAASVPFFAPVFYAGVRWGFKRALFCAAAVFAVAGFAGLLKKRRWSFYAVLLCALIFSLFALARFFFVTAPLLTLIPEKDILSLTGTALSSPVRTSKGNYLLSFAVKSASSESVQASAAGRVSLLLDAGLVEAYYPGRLYTRAHSKTDADMPPFIEKGAFFTVSVKPLQNGLFLAQKAGETVWNSRLDLLRARFRLHLKRVLYIWGDAGGFLLALLSGAREYLDSDLSEAFRRAGLAHILALSGMHLSLFGGLSAAVARFAAGKKTAAVFALISMCLFVWFAGASPSLLRALLCAVLLAAASFCGLKPSILHALCASFIIQTMIFPSDAVQLSFLLSYAALFGIVTVGKVISSFLPFSKTVTEPVAASCGAQLCTAPISLSVFSCLTPAGIPASVVVSPLASLFLYAGLVCLPVSLVFPVLQRPLGFLMGLLYECVRLPVLLFAKIPPVVF